MPTPIQPPASGAEETLSGVIERIVYRSEETGYTVCVLKPRGQGAGLTVVGTCAAVWEGETLEATGHWLRHKTHGLQFVARRMLCVEPHTADGIRKYLASGLIKGIGPVLAERLVARFGDQTLEIIDRESARLEQVPGIGAMRRGQIKAAWNAQKAVRSIMIFLHGHGVGAAQAMRIFRAYGDDAVAVVRRNPYRLAADIWGIGFKTADTIALNVGVPRDSLIRAQAGLVHTLFTQTDEGHCFCPRGELLGAAEQLLAIPTPVLEQALSRELEARRLVQEEDRVYLASLFQAETGIAEALRRLLDRPLRWAPADADKALAWAAARMQLAFAERQAQALRLALTHKASILTGGPGVGKTTLIRALVDIFTAKGLAVCLAAPTGRAAKRMEEATGRPAMTLHRLLQFTPGTGAFEHSPDRPLSGDVFILDEVSMIDVGLMLAFLRAVPADGRLVLVGDADQLPSVGPGNVLRDLIASGALPAVKLDVIFRQRDRSWIVHNAHRVNQGLPLELPPPDAPADFYFIPEDNPDAVVQRAVELVARRIPDRFGLDPRLDIQVLTPMRRFQLGSESLNAVLQEALNPTGASVARFGRTFRVGDRVMQLRNNYDKDVFNGDIGRIDAVSPEDPSVEVRFDGRRVAYELHEMDELSLAYACSIHKAQGSEHPAVVILLATQHYKLLQRNLLYTALTRGRRLVCLVGSRKAVTIAIRTNQTVERRTTLARRLAALGGARP